MNSKFVFFAVVLFMFSFSWFSHLSLTLISVYFAPDVQMLANGEIFAAQNLWECTWHCQSFLFWFFCFAHFILFTFPIHSIRFNSDFVIGRFCKISLLLTIFFFALELLLWFCYFQCVCLISMKRLKSCARVQKIEKRSHDMSEMWL